MHLSADIPIFAEKSVNMAGNKRRKDSDLLVATNRVKIMGSEKTVAEAWGISKMQGCLKGISFISWKDCKWSYDEMMSLEKMSSADFFCMVVRKAGEMDAWLIAESFSDLKEEFAEIFKELYAQKFPESKSNPESKVNEKALTILKSRIEVFEGNGDTSSRILKQRISDKFAKSKREITLDKLTTASGIRLADNISVKYLFVKGDSRIEEKCGKADSKRALKPKFLSSISGNVDIELLIYANNQVNDIIKAIKEKDSESNAGKSLIDSLNLSFISIGTNWETRDGADEDGGCETPGKTQQLAFMKTIIDAIVNRCNVEIDYRPHGYPPMKCKVSPHRLRKDRQWIIYGYSTADVEGVEQHGVFSFKLGRIYGVEKTSGEYIGDDGSEIKSIYKRISCNQVTYDVLQGNPKLQTVVIAVKGKSNESALRGKAFAYNKIREEKIHRTQTEISPEEVERMGHAGSIQNVKDWGFFQFEVCDYNRIAYRLLQYHSNLKVIYPPSLKDRMRKISEELYNLYH